jgi:hypothetical protein
LTNNGFSFRTDWQTDILDRPNTYWTWIEAFRASLGEILCVSAVWWMPMHHGLSTDHRTSQRIAYRLLVFEMDSMMIYSIMHIG